MQYKLSTVATIAIGSTNPVKVAAVRTEAQAIWPAARLVPLAVDSGVGVMPLTDGDAIAGATRRARQARELADADLGVGLEGAAVDTPQGMMLTGWVAVLDRSGRASVANGGRLPLPPAIAERLRAGEELGPLMDAYSGVANSKQHGGAVGFLTRGLVSREESFRMAVAYALVPFLHPSLYP